MFHNQQEQENPQLPPLQLPTMDCDATTQLIMQQEEMASWLQYPLVDSSFDRALNELFYPPPGPPLPLPLLPAEQVPFWPETLATDVNVPHFSGITTMFPEAAPCTSSRNEIRESMTGGIEVVVTSMTGGGGGVASINSSREINTCDLPLTSSHGYSAACATLSKTATDDLMVLPAGDDRKRKGVEQIDEANTELQRQDVNVEFYEPKRQTRGATTKRSRATEIHNLSERRRRVRINEKMKTLQELIPQCTKKDKLSMLDEAIDYLKSLQTQVQYDEVVQMMSMGRGMVPVMFPGIQQYMPNMGMGMGMEMGMGMGMARPMMQLSGPSMPTLGEPSHMNPRFPFQAFQMPHISGTDPSRIQQATNQQYGFQQMPMQMQIPQILPNPQPSSSKPSISRARKDKAKGKLASG